MQNELYNTSFYKLIVGNIKVVKEMFSLKK